MSIHDKQLERYVELIIRVGAGLQKGQKLLLQAPISAHDFASRIAKKAYEHGAFAVIMDWTEPDEVIRSRFLHAPDESFDWYPEWKARSYEEMADENVARVVIYTPNPNLYEGIDSKRIAAATRTRSVALRKWMERIMNDDISWCLVSIPTPAWAAQVFPELPPAEAMDAMWELFLRMSRADGADPIADWEQHLIRLGKRRDQLNAKRYRKLHYKSSITDLQVELPENHLWLSAQSENAKGARFVPNIPTEEVFTMPVKTGVNGVVRSTKPLNYRDQLIENLQLTFKDGKIVEYSASKGLDALKNLLETDEGSHYLGEIALVPHDSPISRSNKIFYNTLFDENASCHLAIGAAYPTNLKGGRTMSREELNKHGANDSLTHEDFMIGSADLSIDGELADGTREPIFRNGNWAF